MKNIIKILLALNVRIDIMADGIRSREIDKAQNAADKLSHRRGCLHLDVERAIRDEKIKHDLRVHQLKADRERCMQELDEADKRADDNIKELMLL